LRNSIELAPNWSAYVTISSAGGAFVLIGLLGIGEGKHNYVQFIAGVELILIALELLYTKNMTVPLDDAGISKGYSFFRVSIPYELIEGVRPVNQPTSNELPRVSFVVSERGSTKRFQIPLRMFDPIKLSAIMKELARRAPQAYIEEATYVQF
jgi:hypothetical protein